MDTTGRRRIRAELALLGYEVAERAVAKYMHRTSPRPSPTWRFLTAHARDIVAIDFFGVPTLTFRLLFVFVVLRHHRRELFHVNVTDHPSAVWTVRQVIEVFPDETGPKYLLRDRDSIDDEARNGASGKPGAVQDTVPGSRLERRRHAQRRGGGARASSPAASSPLRLPSR